MPLPTQAYHTPTAIQEAGRKQLDRTLGQGMQSVFEDPTLRPTQMIGMVSQAAPDAYDKFQSSAAAVPFVGAPVAAYMEAAKAATEQFSDPLPRPEVKMPDGSKFGDPDEVLSPQQVEYEYGHLGLRSKEPIKRSQIDYMASQKQYERRRQEVWDAAPGGLTANLGYLAAGVVGSAIDPLNIAAGFIPVGAVGGKVASFLGSRVAGRVAVGGVEGFIGAAAVEPITYKSAQKLQLDYDAYDAMANLALGTILGGAVKAGGGAVKDLAVTRRARLDRESVIRGATQEGGEPAGDLGPEGPKGPPKRPKGGAPRINDPARMIEFQEGRARTPMSPVGRQITGNSLVVQSVYGRSPKVDAFIRIDNLARKMKAISFNSKRPDRAVGYQMRRYRMYEMAMGREDLDFYTKEDIKAAERDLLDAAERNGLDVTSIEDFKTKYKEYWRNADPAADAEVRKLVDDLKAERENWKWSKQNPQRSEDIMSLIRQYGIKKGTFREAELKQIIGGNNLNMGGGKFFFRKDGINLDDLGKYGMNRLYDAEPGLDDILDDIDKAIRGTGARMEDPDMSIWDEIGVDPRANDESFERAARLHVADKLRPEPDVDTWNKAAAESPDDLRGLMSDDDVEPVTQHLDEPIEYSLDDIKKQDTELDRMIQNLREDGVSLDDDEFDDLMADWINNAEDIDEGIGIGVACVRNG